MNENAIRRGIESEPLLNRALQVFSDARNDLAGADRQPVADKACSSIDQINDLTFAVIRNSQRTLAVYRVTSRGDLKRLEHWPQELE